MIRFRSAAYIYLLAYISYLVLYIYIYMKDRPVYNVPANTLIYCFIKTFVITVLNPKALTVTTFKIHFIVPML